MKSVKLIFLLIFSFTAICGLPPPATKGNGESNYSTTFKTNFGTIPVTRSGTQMTLGTIPVTAGGTGKTTSLVTSDITEDALIGVPTDLLNLKRWLDHMWSAGVTDGGILTDNLDGTINISSGNVMLRKTLVTTITSSGTTATATTATAHGYLSGDLVYIFGASPSGYNGKFSIVVTGPTTYTYSLISSLSSPATGSIVSGDEHSSLYVANIPAATNVVMTNHAITYVIADYNAGSPIWTTTSSLSDFNCIYRCIAYTVANENNLLYIVDARSMNVDANRKDRRRLLETSNFQHEIGGTILTEVGTRNISVSAGSFYYALTKIDHQAFNTSVADTFKTAYTSDSGATWTYASAQTTIGNTQYNNTSSGLASLTVGNYGVYWIYVMNNSPSTLMVLYGQGDYTKSQAFASQEPTVKPSIISGVGALIGRIIIKQGATSFTNVYSSFTAQFPNPSPDLDSLADVSTSSAAVDDTIKFNGTTWISTPATSSVVSAGSGIPFFKATPITKATGSENAIQVATLSTVPVTTAEQTISYTTTAPNGTAVSIGARKSVAALGRTSIPGGDWFFNIYAMIDNAGGTTTLTENIYKITPAAVGTVTITGAGTSRTATASAGTPFTVTAIDASATATVASYLSTPKGLYQITARTSDTVVTISTPAGYVNESAVAFLSWKSLFGVTSPDINNLTPALLAIPATTQPAFVMDAGDYLGTIDFITSSANPRTVTVYYNGTARNSSLSAPLIISHEDLPGLLGGATNEHYHSTAAEYTGSGTGVFARVSSPIFTTPNIGSATGSISGNAATVTTNANLTGVITSSGNATSIASQTGTGTKFVVDTSPTLVTPNIGVANGTSLVLGGTIDANAILDVQSTTKAFMPPRMTTTQRDAVGTPTAGMLVYNSTTNRNEIFNGTLWLPTNAGNLVAKTTTYAILTSDDFITCDGTSAAFTVTLPDAIPLKGRSFDIKKIDSSINAITIATTSSQTIDGVLTKLISTQYESFTIISNGTNWIIR